MGSPTTTSPSREIDPLRAEIAIAENEILAEHADRLAGLVRELAWAYAFDVLSNDRVERARAIANQYEYWRHAGEFQRSASRHRRRPKPI